jgi:hypothetical protein
LDGRFLDTGLNCIKIPYQRKAINTESTTDGTLIVEESFAPTATAVSKFALAGGPQSLLTGVLIILAVCLILALVIFVMQYQSGRLSRLH